MVAATGQLPSLSTNPNLVLVPPMSIPKTYLCFAHIKKCLLGVVNYACSGIIYPFNYPACAGIMVLFLCGLQAVKL
jgi:hypothetical protein